MSQPTINEFFAGKNVFITGATGFLGKALIEKFLRSSPQIGTIYILMRPKRGKEMHERIQTLIQNPVFERVKREQPEMKMHEKIIPLSGDIMELNLGLNPQDRLILTSKVNIIYHVAASVRFDDSLKDAVILNIRGTREVCQLALDCQNLTAHMHVSTAFANCDRSEAREILYPAKGDWKKLIEIAERLDKHILATVTEKYMDSMPNTYCFTKQIAEHVVNDMCGGKIRAKIFRPSIVISSLREEPVRGWIDNFNGPVGILVAFGKGIMRTLYAHDVYKPDYIPIDVVTKALIVSTWDLGLRQISEVEVIQCTTHKAGDWLRANIEKLATHGIKANKETPLNGIFWIPSTHTTTSTLICYIRTVLFMLIPAIFTDALIKLSGNKPILMKLQRKMYVAQLALRHFMNNEWSYTNDNLLELQKKIQQKDRANWDYDFVNDCDFEDYVHHCILGCRRYLLKETDDTIPQAKIHFKRMTRIDQIVKLFLWGLLGYVLWNTGVVYAGFQKIHL